MMQTNMFKLQLLNGFKSTFSIGDMRNSNAFLAKIKTYYFYILSATY